MSRIVLLDGAAGTCLWGKARLSKGAGMEI